MKIMKFGGSSVNTAGRIKKIIEIIRKNQNENPDFAVVFSAFGGVTDELIKISTTAAKRQDTVKEQMQDLENRHLAAVNELIGIKNRSGVIAQVKVLINELEDVAHGVYLVKELSPKTLDFIMSFGERLSAFIISAALNDQGIQAEFLDTRQLILTNDQFGSARVFQKETCQNIADYFQTHQKLQIITGFIAATASHETTTLGRGGSDYTASLFAAALKTTVLEIWTDVNGVMSADPKKVKQAFPIAQMTYEEAMEMSHFGAKVIYPPTIQPVLELKIPIIIKNTFQPDFAGTVIQENFQNARFKIKGISSIENIALMRIQGSGMIGVAGIAARLFGALAKERINIILITQASSEHSICFAVAKNESDRAKTILENEFLLEIQAHYIDKIIAEKECSIVAAVGENMRHTPGIAGKLFQALGQNNVNVIAIAQGSSELNISVVVDKKDETKALQAIHETFFVNPDSL